MASLEFVCGEMQKDKEVELLRKRGIDIDIFARDYGNTPRLTLHFVKESGLTERNIWAEIASIAKTLEYVKTKYNLVYVDGGFDKSVYPLTRDDFIGLSRRFPLKFRPNKNLAGRHGAILKIDITYNFQVN